MLNESSFGNLPGDNETSGTYGLFWNSGIVNATHNDSIYGYIHNSTAANDAEYKYDTSIPYLGTDVPFLWKTSLPGGSWPGNITAEEYLASVNEEFTQLVLPAVIILGVLMVVGAVGNTCVLYVYSCRMKGGTITRFIQALAVFDLLSCCAAIPGEIIDMKNNYTFGKDPLCKIVRTLNLFCTVASGGTLVVVAIDRYKRICCPLRRQIAPRGALIILCCCTVASLVISLPTAALYGGRTILTDSPLVNGTDCSINDRFIDTIFPLAYNGLQMLLFVVGAFILIALYTLIARRICHHAHQRQQRRHSVIIGRKKFAPSSPSSPTTTTENASPISPDYPVPLYMTEPARSRVNGCLTNGVGHIADQSNGLHNHKVMKYDPPSDESFPRKRQDNIFIQENGSSYICVEQPAGSSHKLNNNDGNGTDSTINNINCNKKNASLKSMSQDNTVCGLGEKVLDKSPIENIFAFAQVKENLPTSSSGTSIDNPNPPDFLQMNDLSFKQDRNQTNLQKSAKPSTPRPDFSYKTSNTDSTISPETKDEQQAGEPGFVPEPSFKHPLNQSGPREMRHKEPGQSLSLSNTLQVRKRNRSQELDDEKWKRHSLTLGDMPGPVHFRKKVLFTSSSFGRGDIDKLSKRRRMRSNGTEDQRNEIPEEAKISLRKRRSSLRSLAELKKLAFHSDIAGTRRTTLMLFLITLVYVLSFLPHLVLMTIKALDENSLSGYGGSWELVHNILIRSYFINSVANPIIYSFFSKNFFRECKNSLRCVCKKTRG